MKTILSTGATAALSLLAACTACAEWMPAECTMMTKWGEAVTPENTWRSYPRPQLVRKDNWTCLNGLWKYAVTPKAGGTAHRPKTWGGDILVPFAIEAPLSGVGRLVKPDEMLWYSRSVNVRKRPGERVLLHFGAVDFRAQVFIGHAEVTDVPHEGGNVPFTLDITPYVVDGENELTLAVWDPTSDYYGGIGKQSFHPGGCAYTRVSGIWQTVWLEYVPETYITGYRTTAVDLKAGVVKLVVDGVEAAVDRRKGAKGKAVVTFGGKKVAEAPFFFGEEVSVKLPTPVKAWSPDSPSLYGLSLSYGRDAAKGYVAMRTFEKRRDNGGILRFYLNGEPCFLQGPLDQGWWPDGLLTPPSEEAMKFDIATLKKLGFNMMRKHVKVEPARYYALCDKMGMMVIQDMVNGNGDANFRYGFYRREFKDIVDALRGFPCIVMWCPYNESWGQPGEFLTHATLDWIRRYDPTRLVNGPSGWIDYERDHSPERACEAADTIDLHNYRGPGMPGVNDRRVSFLGEFGGLGHLVEGHLWSKKEVKGWGYGGTDDTGTREGLEKVYLGLMDRLASLARRGLGGSVYTQTTDVEEELNGYMTYDRKVLKFDADKLRKAHLAVYDAALRAAKFKYERAEVFPRESEWAYTFDAPAAGWEKEKFDDSAWKRGKGRFGSFGGCAVEWKTSDIWARRHFEYKGLGDFTSVALDLFHDEDAEVYVNGVKVFEISSYNGGYEVYPVDMDAFKSAARVGDNVMSVHVKQTVGGQCFDTALVLERVVE